MTAGYDVLDEALDGFKAMCEWKGATEIEKALVIGNLNGFVSHLRDSGLIQIPKPHPADCNHPCCD